MYARKSDIIRPTPDEDRIRFISIGLHDWSATLKNGWSSVEDRLKPDINLR
jgi:hypothetical protein